MPEITYSVTGPGIEGEYGIAAFDHIENAGAAITPVFRDRAEADSFAEALNAKQIPVPVFCDAFLENRLSELF